MTPGTSPSPPRLTRSKFAGMAGPTDEDICAGSLQQPFQNRLLRVEPIACLLERAALRAVQHVVRDLFAAMGRQTVQYDGVFWGLRQESRVHLVRGKRLQPMVAFRFLAHARPNIGINHVRVLHGFDGIGFRLPWAANQKVGVEAETAGRREAKSSAEQTAA